MSEVWKDIPGYEGRYQASTEGRIRSVDRIITCSNRWGSTNTRRVPGRLLPGHKRRDGYVLVSLGHANPMYVHSLVALTFLGARPENCDVCHADGDPSNNTIGNLRYATRSENLLDEYRAGRSWNSNLSATDVRTIRVLAESGFTCAEIGKKYDLGASDICDIKNKRVFAWVE